MSLCVSCKCVNASIGNVEHWMCGESWLAIKDLQPTIPSSKAGHLVCFLIFIFYSYSIFIWTYNLCLSMCACKPSRLPVCVCVCACGFLSRRGCLYIYYKHPCTAVHNSIPLLSPFLRLSLFFYFPFLNASVLYTYFPCTCVLIIAIAAGE